MMDVRQLFLVDDNPEDRELTGILLARAERDLPVQGFPSGEAIIDRLSELSGHPPASFSFFIFLDVKMPGLTGLDVLEWIRQHAVFDSVPIVMWSTSDDPRDLAKASELGAQCYLGKYPPLATLREVLAACRTFNPTAPERVFNMRGNLLLGREPLPRMRPK